MIKTVEEKAKAYDEAKYIMKEYLESGNAGVITENTIKKAFPELVESEDEKIRKALIEYFNEQCDMSDWNGVYGYQVIAWLEKQGEQKPQRIVSAEAKEAMYDKPAWSEEDDYNLQCCIAKVQNDIDNGRIGRNRELLTWLKSLKERVQLQPKQEWSMYDETILKTLIDHFEYKKEFNEAEDYDIVLWLKSLRPQSQWKPSDEQLEAVKRASNGSRAIAGNDYLIMESLYNDLKKLRGE